MKKSIVWACVILLAGCSQQKKELSKNEVKNNQGPTLKKATMSHCRMIEVKFEHVLMSIEDHKNDTTHLKAVRDFYGPSRAYFNMDYNFLAGVRNMSEEKYRAYRKEYSRLMRDPLPCELLAKKTLTDEDAQALYEHTEKIVAIVRELKKEPLLQ